MITSGLLRTSHGQGQRIRRCSLPSEVLVEFRVIDEHVVSRMDANVCWPASRTLTGRVVAWPPMTSLAESGRSVMIDKGVGCGHAQGNHSAIALAERRCSMNRRVISAIASASGKMSRVTNWSAWSAATGCQ